MRIRDLYSQGPFTVFAPHADYVANFSVCCAPINCITQKYYNIISQFISSAKNFA